MDNTFLSYFCTMKDHRINRRKRHPLQAVKERCLNFDFWD